MRLLRCASIRMRSAWKPRDYNSEETHQIFQDDFSVKNEPGVPQVPVEGPRESSTSGVDVLRDTPGICGDSVRTRSCLSSDTGMCALASTMSLEIGAVRPRTCEGSCPA